MHETHPLDQALRRAGDSSADGGRIDVENCDYESADEKTLRWFASAIRLIEAEGMLVETDALLSKTETVNAWREHQGHELHTAGAYGAQIQKPFRDADDAVSPYCFRSLYGANAEPVTAASDI